MKKETHPILLDICDIVLTGILALIATWAITARKVGVVNGLVCGLIAFLLWIAGWGILYALTSFFPRLEPFYPYSRRYYRY